MVFAPGQLSTAVGAGKVTTAEQELAAEGAVMLPGHVTTGPSVSLTVTVKVFVSVFPAASVAVDVTVVAPLGNTEPEAGLLTTLTPAQLSVAVTVKVTTA